MRYELALAFRVCDAVIGVTAGQFQLERAVSRCHVRIGDEVVPEAKALPVVEVGFDHVDMMCAHSRCAPLDEPRIEWWLVEKGGAPEVVVSLALEHRNDTLLRLLQRPYFHEHVDDGLCRQSRDRSAAEVLYATYHSRGQAAAQVSLLRPECIGPRWIMRDYRNLFSNRSGNSLFQRFHCLVVTADGAGKNTVVTRVASSHAPVVVVEGNVV